MLSSIHPLGERAKGNRWSVTVTAFVIGSTSGGLVAGALAGLLGTGLSAVFEPSSTTVLALVLGVQVVALVLDVADSGARVPGPRRQVDEVWLTRYRGWVYGVGYGFQLGFGFMTIVTSMAVYATFAVALLSGSVIAGAVVGAVFGLVRGAAILPGRRITTPTDLRTFHRRLATYGRRTARLAPLGQGIVVLAAAALVLIV